MLRWMVGIHKSNWHTVFVSTLWAYQTSVNSSTRFTPFQLVYGTEAILSIESEIPSLKIVVKLLWNTSNEEECILYLMQLDENRHDSSLVIETPKKHVKDQYGKHVKPHVFYEGDLILLYLQDRDLLGAGKFKPMWWGHWNPTTSTETKCPNTSY
jgi:hypothetical protein